MGAATDVATMPAATQRVSRRIEPHNRISRKTLAARGLTAACLWFFDGWKWLEVAVGTPPLCAAWGRSGEAGEGAPHEPEVQAAPPPSASLPPPPRVRAREDL